MTPQLTAIQGAAAQRYAGQVFALGEQPMAIGRRAEADLCTSDASGSGDDLTISDQQLTVAWSGGGRVTVANTSRSRSCFLHPDEDAEPEGRIQPLAPGATTTIDLLSCGQVFLFLGGHRGARAPHTILRLALPTGQQAPAVDTTINALRRLGPGGVRLPRLDLDRRDEFLGLLTDVHTWTAPDTVPGPLTDALDGLLAGLPTGPQAAEALVQGLMKPFAARAVLLTRGQDLVAGAGTLPRTPAARTAWLRVLGDHYAGFASSRRASLHYCRAKAPSAATRAKADLGQALVGRLGGSGLQLTVLCDHDGDVAPLVAFWRLVWWLQGLGLTPTHLTHPDDLESRWLLAATHGTLATLAQAHPHLAQAAARFGAEGSVQDLATVHDALVKAIGLATGYEIRLRVGTALGAKGDDPDMEPERWLDTLAYYNRAWIATRLFTADLLRCPALARRLA